MEFYHVLSRGVEKRSIAEDDKDRLRFVHDLWAFNGENATPNFILKGRHADTDGARKRLVHIHAWCLMPNHYHLLLSPIADDGIPKFIKKLNMGYTKYFNEKYKRSGALWQGKHKKILIERDAHFLYIPLYIHLNPLDMRMPEWRKGGIRNVEEALSVLQDYRWSSHLDYYGRRNFPSIISKDAYSGIMGDLNTYKAHIRDVVKDGSIAAEASLLEK